MPGRFRQPYRGDGYSSVPRRFPLNENEKLYVRGLGYVLFATSLPLIYLIFTTQSLITAIICVVGILLLLIFFFAFRDALGIKPHRPVPAHRRIEKDQALFDDYMARIEWEQKHHFKGSQNLKWLYEPILATRNTKKLNLVGLLSPLLLTPHLALAYFFGIKSPITIIGAFLFGFIEIFAYLIYSESKY